MITYAQTFCCFWSWKIFALLKACCALHCDCHASNLMFLSDVYYPVSPIVLRPFLDAMSVVLMKIVYLAAMAIAALLFGLIPLKEQNAWKTNYPFNELLIATGFFAIYLVEVVCNNLCGHQSHASFEQKENGCKHSNNEDDMTEYNIQQRSNGEHSSSENVVQEAGKQQVQTHNFYRKSLTLVIAFSFHSCLEGFAFGVQVI
ncbi:unnamed protein product [Gongylonema pulchrum]|uniref:Zinc transporter ZIP3 n=1 Tax=Gongylonema pulchrum TaxID=637853 RepID=A0A183CZ27_9BILA|nr:unnamed protein product [Gongylonema pulchrum]